MAIIYESICPRPQKQVHVLSSFLAYSSLAVMASCMALPWKYDVFLSFRGEDTRKNFTSHLFAALSQKGIATFKNDQEVEQGKTLSQQLINVIQESKISIVIFSRNFASSTCCLDQLVEIFQSMKTKGQLVFPVFYGVDPSEVRKQSGRFGESFAEHQQLFKQNIGKVQQWRLAATQLANLNGWDLQDRHESELIEEIVKEVLKILRKSNHRITSAAKNFVGMSSHLKKMDFHLVEGQLNDVRFVGICGMGGIGKTTIARAIYAHLSSQFEGSCFLPNIREFQEKHGLIPLQEQLLSEILMERNITIWDAHSGTYEIRNKLHHRRVLVVLDDVNQLDQLKSLAGLPDWFGSGSRIIITTRDEHLLLCHGVEKIYKVEGLHHDQALHLFSLRAFRNNYPAENFLELSNHFVNYANGLPLALDVLGSFLYGGSIDEWQSALDRLKEIPNKEILDKLYISFDGLEELEKKIFLDIACFFKGEEKDYVIKVLECCGFCPDVGIRILINKSLITISDDRIWMHDLLQEMGQEIVRRSCYEEPGKQSRLWLYKDVCHVLRNNTGTEQIEGIVLDSCEQQDEHPSAKAFVKMKNLRLLVLKNLHLSEGLEHLSNKLRYLYWDRYPFKTLPSTFQPDELVEMHMRYSNIKELWKGMKLLKALKVIDLSYSVNLIKTMDFKVVPNLKNLNLEGCIRLCEIHQSIGLLKRLIFLNLKDCKGLIRLPNSICDLKSLKILILQGCSKLDEMPERLGDITGLEKLRLGGIASRQLPYSKLWDLLLPSWLLPRKNPNLMDFMPSLSGLCSLRTLDLSYCNLKEGALPNDLSCFPSLQTLNLSGNDFVSIPTSINLLSKLEDLWFVNCKRLQSLPSLPSSILYLSTDGCSSLGTSLPKTISRHYKLENLCFATCERLQSLPALSSSIVHLKVDGLTAQETSPNSLEKDDSKNPSLTFVTNLQLVEIQGKNCSAFARLTSYLHFLLKHSSQGFFNPSSHLSMRLAGNELPEWFNFQGMGTSLEVQLPPHWFNNKWMGFSICVVFEVIDPLSSEPPTLFCDLEAQISPKKLLFLSRPGTEISGDTSSASNQLWFNFIPRTSLNSVAWLEACGNLKASIFPNGLKVKYCGLRIIYDHDVGELLQCNKPSKRLGILCDDNAGTSKRSHDDDDDCCCDCSEEPESESGNSVERSHSKRLKMFQDSYVKPDGRE